jgi:hypothetical protein
MSPRDRIIEQMAARIPERRMRSAVRDQMYQVEPGAPDPAIASHQAWTEAVGEPTARNLIAEATGVPGVARAASNTYNEPSIANATDLGTRTALMAFRPVAAAKTLAAGLGLGTVSDLGGLTPPAVAQTATAGAGDGLSPDQYKQLQRLEAAEKARKISGADLQQLRRLRELQADYTRELNRSKIAGDAAGKSKDREEYDRAVRVAERARDQELARERRFSDTTAGQIWDKTGGLMPMVFGGVAGGLSRAATGGGSNLYNYGIPAALGGIAGGSLNNLPLAYNSFATEPDNPVRRAYEAYARELPTTHPRKAEWRDYAAGLPEANPIREVAARELYDPWKAAERMGFGAVEGVGGALIGADAMRIPGRLRERNAGMAGRMDEAKLRSETSAERARAEYERAYGAANVARAEESARLAGVGATPPASPPMLGGPRGEPPALPPPPARTGGTIPGSAADDASLLPGAQPAGGGAQPQTPMLPDPQIPRSPVPTAAQQSPSATPRPTRPTSRSSSAPDTDAGDVVMGPNGPINLPSAGIWARNWSDAARGAVDAHVSAGGSLAARTGLTAEQLREAMLPRLSGVKAPSLSELKDRLADLRGYLGDNPTKKQLKALSKADPEGRFFAAPLIAGGVGAAAYQWPDEMSPRDRIVAQMAY